MARIPEALDITLPDGRVIRVGLKTLMKADDEEFCDDCLAGVESSEHHRKCVADRPLGFVIAEHVVYGPQAGRLVIDWDGLVHETRQSADAELARANAPDEEDPTASPSDHWELYELWPVKP